MHCIPGWDQGNHSDSDGRWYSLCAPESDFHIKGVALARGRVLLPMRALYSIGKFADRRLTLLWIGTRVSPSCAWQTSTPRRSCRDSSAGAHRRHIYRAANRETEAGCSPVKGTDYSDRIDAGPRIGAPRCLVHRTRRPANCRPQQPCGEHDGEDPAKRMSTVCIK